LLSPCQAGYLTIIYRKVKEIQLLDLRSKCIHSTFLTYFGAFCLGLSQDGAHLITDGPQHTLRVRSVRSGEVCRTMQGHTDGVTCIAVSINNTIASSSIDGSVRLWEPTAGGCMATLQAPSLYAGMRIRNVRGITPAQRASLLLFGAQV